MSRLRTRIAVWLLLTAVPLLGLGGLVFGDAERLQRDRWIIAVIALVAFAAFASGWLGLLRPAITRIERASATVSAIADGRVDGRIDDRVPDEIGQLGANIDRLATQRDVDGRRRDQAEERLAHNTAHDALTGLCNRQTFRRELESALALDDDGPGRAVSVEVVMIDLDDFTLVNELWGQSVGDQVLVTLAGRLRRLVGDEIELARWSGDEFVIMLVDVDSSSVAQLIIEIERMLDEPVNTTAGPQKVFASVVTASAQVGRASLDEVFHDINVQLRNVKEDHARTRTVNPETARLVELALTQDRLQVSYQPLVELLSETGTRMVGAEAFVRLLADDGTLHVATDFLGDIMTSSYARQIDHRMATKVIGHLASWLAAGLVPDDFQVTLNLSPASLRDLDLGRDLMLVCQTHGVNPRNIVLDVSEEAGELDQIIAAELRQSGFELSIDDLGYKRSNFDRLFTLGAEFAKLHSRWIDDDDMLEALVGICQRKGLQVVAKGIETMEQLQRLYRHGIRFGQGYLISRPLPFDAFTQMLSAGSSAVRA